MPLTNLRDYQAALRGEQEAGGDFDRQAGSSADHDLDTLSGQFADGSDDDAFTASPEEVRSFEEIAQRIADGDEAGVAAEAAAAEQARRPSMGTATAEMVPVRVPKDDDFDGADFMVDEVLEAVFWDVVRQYERLHVIPEHDISVRVVWKRKGGKSHGGAVLAKCVKTSGLVRFFGEHQFVIWLAADHLDVEQYSTKQLRSLLAHEAMHIGWEEPVDEAEDGPGKPILVGHDVELFLGEIEMLGEWESFRRRLGNEFRQPALFGGEQDGAQ